MVNKKIKKILVYVPALNEEGNIFDVVKNVLNIGVNEIVDGLDSFDCMVVDDGSTDKTMEKAISAGAKVVRHRKNMGVGAAFHSGVLYALENDYDILVSIDADGQFNSQEIKVVLRPIIEDEMNFVTGNRFVNSKPASMPSIKYFGNLFMSKMISSLVGEKFQDVSCGFRAYDKEALLNLNLYGVYTYTQETFLDLKFKNLRLTEVPISVKYFSDRKSRVAGNIFKYAWKTANIILRSFLYYKPLKFFSYPGLLSLLLGFGFVLFMMGHKFSVGTYTPYKAFGFIGAAFLIFGIVLVLIGFVVDIIDKIRMSQDKLLYFQKKNEYRNKEQ